MANCQVGTCKICSQNGQGKDKRFTDCNTAGGSKSSPCGICSSGEQQDGNIGCNFAGSILVDAIAAIIFFFFWMMQFWLNIASCVFQALKHLYNADRSTQIVAGAIFVLLCGSILIHGMFGKSCRGTHVHLQHSQSSSSSSSPSSSSSSSNSKSQAQGSQSACQSKLRGGFFSSRSKGSGGGGDASVSASISVNAKVKASSQSNEQGGSLKVKLKDSKLSKKTGQLEKTFYLVITDERKKKLYETSAKFNLPSDLSEKPALMLTTDPIILENY